MHTTYLDVPKEWLGEKFIEDAEWLKETNPSAYDHEYMGVAIGEGGAVFDNFFILDEEIKESEKILFSFPIGVTKRPIALKFIDSFEVQNYDECPYGADLKDFDVQFGIYNKIIGYHKEIREEIYERNVLSK